MIADYAAAHHLAYEPFAYPGVSGVWDLRLFDNYYFYIFYPPFNYLPVMFCGTVGGHEVTDLLKRSRRVEECASKNTCIETPHNYHYNEVGCQ